MHDCLNSKVYEIYLMSKTVHKALQFYAWRHFWKYFKNCSLVNDIQSNSSHKLDFDQIFILHKIVSTKEVGKWPNNDTIFKAWYTVSYLFGPMRFLSSIRMLNIFFGLVFLEQHFRFWLLWKPQGDEKIDT